MLPRPAQASLRLFGLLLLSALWTPAAAAKAWRQFEPGVSQRAQVIEAFGAPERAVKVRDREVLIYSGTRRIKGTQRVHFRVETESGLIERIDVFPAAVISRKVIENTYGGACAVKTAPRPDCYVQKVAEDTRVYFHYEPLGLAVFFNRDGKTVFSLVYSAPKEVSPVQDQTLAGRTPEQTEESPGGETAPPPAETPSSEVPAAEGIAAAGGTDDVFMGTEDALREDPLRIGGLVYLRGQVGTTLSDRLRLSEAAAPMLVDVYLDGRPNENLRTMVVGRLLYDPTNQQLTPLAQPRLDQPLSNPAVVLDQLWINLNVARSVYVTLGRQRIKWGSARFWNPTDFLIPARVDVLATFDPRVGTDMVKLHLPLEQLSSNLYAIGTIDALGPPGSPLRPGGALRAEAVLLGAELALSAVYGGGRQPRYGVDLSTALGPVDVHVEVGLETDRLVSAWRRRGDATSETAYSQQFEPVPDQLDLRAAGGLMVLHQLSETRALQFGVEGFYNATGYWDPAIVPWLMATGSFRPFYAGALYAAALAGYANTEVFEAMQATVSVVANVADRSLLARADAAFTVHRDLTLDVFVAAPFGATGSEFKLGMTLPEMTLPDGTVFPATALPAPLFTVGAGMQLKF